MGSAANGGRISVHTIAVIFLLLGVVLTAVGIMKTDWQHVNLVEEQQYHEHGLWQNCVKVTGTGTWNCVYIDYAQKAVDRGTQNDHHQPRSWKLETLALMVSACCFGLLGLLFSFYAACCFCCENVPAVAILWNILLLLATLMSVVGIVIFSIHAHDPKEVAVLGLTTTYEQKIGLAYWLSVGGVGAFVISLLLSIGAAVLIGVNRHRDGYTAGVKR